MVTALLLLLLILSTCALVLAWQLRQAMKEQAAKLEALEGLSFLPDRVQALAREVEACDIGAVMKEMEALHLGIDRLEDGLAAPKPVAPSEIPRPQAVRALINRHLRQEGYQAVVIENADEELLAPRVEVRLRAMRDGAPWRGQVTVDAEEVIDHRLEATFSAFP